MTVQWRLTYCVVSVLTTLIEATQRGQDGAAATCLSPVFGLAHDQLVAMAESTHVLSSSGTTSAAGPCGGCRYDASLPGSAAGGARYPCFAR